ncbi:MAG TPA: 2,3,4,5-tetrahydropyridine-2,6-dicarboxylate N-succinyltransferase [Gemmatimonadales bacterium]|nr:2,3,4,5-tetrahydropyridine-2,6-dicarboxylate N-succinyltransferase [Gemmatimonadales bacterium]
MSLRERVEALATDGEPFSEPERATFAEFRAALTAGVIRAAERDSAGTWHAHAWVKRGILTGFRRGALVDCSVDRTFRFFDKDTFPVRPTTLAERVRIVPGGSTARDGCYLAPGVICMPPAYVNVGAYVDQGTLVDSHVLVGSCAQIGRRVHLSAAAQIGGVLEPAGALPVVIEDDVLVGGGCGVYEGTVVRAGAVLAAGTVLTGSTPVYDLTRDTIYRRPAGGVLEIPAGAVVVPGARAARGPFAAEHGLALYTPVIVKYRDAQTDAATALEAALR